MKAKKVSCLGKCRGGALLFVGVAAVVLALGLFDERFWRYERSAILAGEWWRLLTGQWFHTSPVHALWNVGGVALAWWLVGPVWRPGEWLAIALMASISVGAGLLLLYPEIDWYLGLSGLLHGLFMAGSIGLLLEPLPTDGTGSRLEGGVLLFLLGSKLGWEQYAGPLPGVESVADGRVIVEAHLAGTAGGAMGAGYSWLRHRWQSAPGV